MNWLAVIAVAVVVIAVLLLLGGPLDVNWGGKG